MSRSFRHTKIFPRSSATSDRGFKRLKHRIARVRVREELHKANCNPDHEFQDINPNRVLDYWLSDKDGKHYYKDASNADMRK